MLAARALLHRRRAGPPRCSGLVDLNGFKAFNDTFGHPGGDALLVRLAEAFDAAAVRAGTGNIQAPRLLVVFLFCEQPGFLRASDFARRGIGSKILETCEHIAT